MRITDGKTEKVRRGWLAWMCFVVGFDLILMIILMAFPNCFLYDLATKYRWGITPSWVGTTIASIIVMAAILWAIIKNGRRLSDEWYLVLALFSLIWVLELVVYETIIGAYHISKLGDALRWSIFWYASYRVYKIDCNTFVH